MSVVPAILANTWTATARFSGALGDGWGKNEMTMGGKREADVH